MKGLEAKGCKWHLKKIELSAELAIENVYSVGGKESQVIFNNLVPSMKRE